MCNQINRSTRVARTNGNPRSVRTGSVIRRNRSWVMVRRSASKRSGDTTAFATPVSSSTEMKTWPRAVPGRCRKITAPPMVISAPCLALPTSFALHSSGRCSRMSFSLVKGALWSGLLRQHPDAPVHALTAAPFPTCHPAL